MVFIELSQNQLRVSTDIRQTFQAYRGIAQGGQRLSHCARMGFERSMT